eukprot:2932615-Pleurochrysis_carterae.AAC.1
MNGEGNTATGGCRASLTYGGGGPGRPRAALTLVQWSVSIPPRLRRVSENKWLQPARTVALVVPDSFCVPTPVESDGRGSLPSETNGVGIDSSSTELQSKTERSLVRVDSAGAEAFCTTH